MIKTFKCKETQRIFDGLSSRKFQTIAKVAKRKLDMIHFANSEQDLIVPPANHFEHLKGNLQEYCSIRINDQFRIIFKWKEGIAKEVQIVDYH